MSTNPSAPPLSLTSRLKLRGAALLHGDGMRARMLRGSGWTMAGYAISQAMRLGSSLILTRLLVPEAYGLMSLAQVFLTGVQMFSDLGLKPAIIQSKRGFDPIFLNTAWTIQIARGLILWAILSAIALPVAGFYGEPQLATILIVLGSTAVIQGFRSTALFTEQKRLRLRSITVIELIGQSVAIVSMIIWAVVHPSVWALAGGAVIGSMTSLFLSFRMLPSHQHRLQWDSSSVSQLLSFGAWIFLSSIMGFLAANGDRLLLGRFLSTSDLGMYQIALNLALLARILHERIANMVMLPFYAARQDDDRRKIRQGLVRIRLSLAGVLLAPTCLLVIFGQEVIDLLYDDRYAGAGWKLQILAAGGASFIAIDIGNYLLPLGQPRTFAMTVLLKSICIIGCMAVGGAVAGPVGLIVGVAAGPLAYYPLHVAFARRFGLWIGRIDLILLAVVGTAAAIAWLSR